MYKPVKGGRHNNTWSNVIHECGSDSIVTFDKLCIADFVNTVPGKYRLNTEVICVALINALAAVHVLLCPLPFILHKLPVPVTVS